MIVGVDASRNRSGGAKAHIIGLLTGADPREHGIRQVHLWAYPSLMAAVPDFPWLVKHSPPELNASLPRQIWWQYRHLPREAAAAGCEVMFNTDAGSVCPFRPGVTLSQDMLSYEPGEMARYRGTKAWLRLLALKYLQCRSLKKARTAVFLTEYARMMIQRSSGPLPGAVVIPHGIGAEFRAPRPPRPAAGGPLKCLYVSNAAPYKHQWHVVEAVAAARRQGADLSLLLVGGGKGPSQLRLERALAQHDPKGEFAKQLAFVEHAKIPALIAEADIFVFASSCENLPITLLEGMAGGLPIACSDRGPMPEVLRDGGVYFDPEDPATIARALLLLAGDPELRERMGAKSRALSEAFTWERCSRETWALLSDKALEARGARAGQRKEPG